jgi:hypothetical protein
LTRIDIGGWALFAAGALLLAIAITGPAWVDVRALMRQRDALEEYQQQLSVRHQQYKQFIDAAASGDRFVLQRLAWHELRLRPAGARPLDPAEPSSPATSSDVRQWFDRNLSDATQPPPPPPPSRLDRLMDGPRRLPLTLVGLLFIAASMFSADQSFRK